MPPKLMTALDGYKALRVVIVVLLIYVVVAFFANLYTQGYVDFPCSVRHFDADNCIDVSFPPNATGEGVQLEAFLTSYSTRFVGGSCNYQKSATNTLDVRSGLLDLQLERTDSVLRVNNEVLNTGSQFQYTRPFDIDPWLISQVQFRNLGPVTHCKNASTGTTIAVIGSEGASISPTKGLGVLLILGAGLWIVNRNVRRLNRTANTGSNPG